MPGQAQLLDVSPEGGVIRMVHGLLLSALGCMVHPWRSPFCMLTRRATPARFAVAPIGDPPGCSRHGALRCPLLRVATAHLRYGFQRDAQRVRVRSAPWSCWGRDVDRRGVRL